MISPKLYIHSLLRAGLLATAAIAATAIAANQASATEMAPDFTLKSNQGDNIRLSDHRGEVVLLNFWASYCGPCRQEMPLLNKINERYSNLGFTVIGVNIDENSALANTFLKDTPVSFPILYDNTKAISPIYVKGMPTTVMIDRDGNMRHIHSGYHPGLELEYEKEVKELIKE